MDMNDGNAADSPRRIKSIQTASRILEAIQSLSRPTFSALCDEVDVSKGTVHTYLETLADEGFVAKSDDSYHLGLRFVTLGESVRNQTDLYRVGQEEVEKLAEKTGEWVHLTVEYQGKEVTIYESSGDRAIAMDYHLRMRESPQHLHHTATGKAMLAYFDETRTQAIIDQEGLPQQTPETITDPAELSTELEQICDRGYAVNDEEEVRGLRSIGAPIQNIESNVLGAISITSPTSRLSGEYFEIEIPKLVTQAANIIEVNLETATVENQ